MSVTGKPKDPIPHGLEGYRKYGCTCDDGTVNSCLGANRAYQREMRAKRAQARLNGDELAAKRVQRKKPKTESSDSVRKRPRALGEMEKAVIKECAEIVDAKPTLVVAAKNLGRNVDDLAGDIKVIALYNSTMKQLMATMAELRGDKDKPVSRKKSGGRMATVGNLTKVKRAQ